MLKKIYTALFVVLTAISFSSCVKGFTCSCKSESSSASHYGVYNREEDIVDTKKNAQGRCDVIKSEMQGNPQNGPVTCTLR